MSQIWNDFAVTGKPSEDILRLEENLETLKSQFGGTAFPSNPTAGQPCFRTDLGLAVAGGGTTGQWFTYSGNVNAGQSGWVLPEDMSEISQEIINSRGSKLTLDQRLDISLNEDGTLKDNVTGVISEWQDPTTLTFTFISSNTFKTNGNTTDIYKVDRFAKANITAQSIYTKVVSSTYNGGQDETNVVLDTVLLDNTLIDVHYLLISPEHLGYTQEESDALARKDLRVVHNITADEDYILTSEQNQYGTIEITDTGTTLTGDINIIINNDEHTFLFINSTLQDLTVKTSAGTGIFVSAGEARELRNDTVNIETALSNALNTTNEVQTKIGDLTIGQEVSISSWSYVTTTITINTATAHNLLNGQEVRINGLVATTNIPQGIYTIASIVDTDTFTFTAADTPTGTPTVSSATVSSGDLKVFGKFIGKNVLSASIKFDGATATIKESSNISSVVRNSIGNYTLTFADAMDNADYSAIANKNTGTTTQDSCVVQNETTASFVVRNRTNGSDSDNVISVHITGGKN